MFLKIETHHAGCSICRSVTGPFVACDVPNYSVETVQGPIAVDQPLVLCAATEQREGCVGEAARAAGYVSGDTHAQLEHQATDYLVTIRELEQKLADAADPRVVKVTDLLDLVGEQDTVEQAPAA